MCTGIVLKNGKHLQSIKEIEDHFKVNLEPYIWSIPTKLYRNCCTCQIDLDRFMSEEPRRSEFEYDHVEYWEIGVNWNLNK